MSDTLADLAEVLTVVAGIDSDQLGPLTDGELLALEWADDALQIAAIFASATGSDTLDALMSVPAVTRLVTSLLASLRAVVVRAQALDVDIGPLGPGVKIEAE